jgi:hypothetical protein
MSAALRAAPGLPARVGRIIGIVLVFVVAGPPIGGLAFLLLALLVTTSGAMGKFDPVYELTVSPPPVLLISGMVVSYLFGAGPVAAAGLAIGIKQAFFGPTAWWMALGAGFAVGTVLLERLGEDLDLGRFQAVLILACVVPIMLCWGMVRNWHFASAVTEAAP